MIRRLLPLLICTFFISALGLAQTTEELAAQKEAKAAELSTLEAQLAELQGKVDGLKSEIAVLTDKLTPYPRWEKRAFGTVGFNFTRFNDWFQKDQPNTSAATIAFTLNGIANLDQKKYFWRNAGTLNLSWLKFDDKDNPDDEADFRVASDAFNLSSLFGYKLNKKIAISAMGEYRTAILDGKFNNPGFLDLGAGVTFTPIKNLVVVVHPGNYNFVFSDEGSDFNSSVGLKLVVDYAQKLPKGIAWKTNFSSFISYEDVRELTNWTWVNGFSTAVKGLGIGVDVGIRQSKQEAKAREIGGNPLQLYYVLGLSYSF